MYSKEEAKQLKINFWNHLGSELESVRGVNGNKVSWMSFNTKIKHLYFRMEADETSMRLCIDLQFPDNGVREVFFEQFLEFKERLDQLFEGNNLWLENFDHSSGKTISRIAAEKQEVNFLDQSKWVDMHEFLKGNFIKYLSLL